jgi:hypothetical protein
LRGGKIESRGENSQGERETEWNVSGGRGQGDDGLAADPEEGGGKLRRVSY